MLKIYYWKNEMLLNLIFFKHGLLYFLLRQPSWVLLPQNPYNHQTFSKYGCVGSHVIFPSTCHLKLLKESGTTTPFLTVERIQKVRVMVTSHQCKHALIIYHIYFGICGTMTCTTILEDNHWLDTWVFQKPIWHFAHSKQYQCIVMFTLY